MERGKKAVTAKSAAVERGKKAVTARNAAVERGKKAVIVRNAADWRGRKTIRQKTVTGGRIGMREALLFPSPRRKENEKNQYPGEDQDEKQAGNLL